MIILLVENVAEHEEANHGEEASNEVLKWPCTMSDTLTQTQKLVVEVLQMILMIFRMSWCSWGTWTASPGTLTWTLCSPTATSTQHNTQHELYDDDDDDDDESHMGNKLSLWATGCHAGNRLSLWATSCHAGNRLSLWATGCHASNWMTDAVILLSLLFFLFLLLLLYFYFYYFFSTYIHLFKIL